MLNSAKYIAIKAIRKEIDFAAILETNSNSFAIGNNLTKTHEDYKDWQSAIKNSLNKNKKLCKWVTYPKVISLINQCMLEDLEDIPRCADKLML